MESVFRLAGLPTSFPGHFRTNIGKYMIFLIGTPNRLETHVSYRKQTTAPLSNRDKFAFFRRPISSPSSNCHISVSQMVGPENRRPPLLLFPLAWRPIKPSGAILHGLIFRGATCAKP